MTTAHCPACGQLPAAPTGTHCPECGLPLLINADGGHGLKWREDANRRFAEALDEVIADLCGSRRFSSAAEAAFARVMDFADKAGTPQIAPVAAEVTTLAAIHARRAAK